MTMNLYSQITAGLVCAAIACAPIQYPVFSAATNGTIVSLSSVQSGTGLEIGSTLKPNQVLIIGDSISDQAWGGQTNKKWWQYLLDNKRGMFKLSAKSGSGYITKGSDGTTFYERLSAINKIKPKAIIIAGGVNDRNKNTAPEGIRRYFTQLAVLLKSNDISPKNVYTLVLRPTDKAGDIASEVKANSKRIGVNYTDAGVYSTTLDGLHPDSVGAKKIATDLATSTDLYIRLK